MPARAAAARARLVRPLPADRPAGWLGPLGVMVFAGVLRFWRLGDPRAFVFDETYYAKDAFTLLHYGVEQGWDKDVDKIILADGFSPRLLSGDPAYVVHPPLGKWLVALGEKAFGFDSFGWRFSVAVLGTLSVLMLARIARRMFGSTLLGCVAGLLLALDGMHFVQSRTALLDPILMFFVLAAFGCLLADRDTTRARLARAVDAGVSVRELGPWLGVRWWRLGAGVCLGAACATKWSGLWYVAAFALLSLAWDVSARRAAGVRRPFVASAALDAIPAFVSTVVVAAVVYVASWTGWFVSGDRGYDRYWASENGEGGGLVPDAVVSWLHYQSQALSFHRGLTSSHPYESNPWSWLVLGRPVAFFYEGPKEGADGCTVAQCSKAVTALGTPAIWWAAILALLVLVGLWAGRGDWRAGAILVGVAAGYLPWFAFQGRTIYSFYAVVFVPFLVLGVTMCLGLLLGPPDASPRRRAVGTAVVGAYVLLVLANFAFLYPALSAEVLPYAEWAKRMWWRSWI